MALESNLRDYCVGIAKNGWLLLVGIDLCDGQETVYFRKNLHSNGAACFTVEYDQDEDDLVAAPCLANDGFDRSQLRRGSDDQ